ncbi:trypsin [candidate division TA06 bacterium B3_TA06]|uniref:Trypsin n=1 Tax=candidate division TA06 bacterium B3_TA06 TaxID=2012487 RepID=A0A532UU56_UNCT6|nr:MAG: trypsin [candidate division TA06 bacterium B3_TA06]
MKFVKLLILSAVLAFFIGADKVRVETETPEGVSIASGDITQGSLQILKDGKTLELPLEHTDVDAYVSGYIARVNVTQHFTNPYKEPIEAVYVFPLPENAAVDAMTMKIGEKVIKGVIKKREEARQIYEEAIQEGKTASLLEQERPNIFTQTVGNIMPGDDIYIEISYVQDLAYDHGTYEYVFPMVVGPRFIPGTRNTSTGKQGGGWSEDTEEVPDASRITPPVLKPEYRSGHDISLKLTVDAGVPIQNFVCPSHKIKQSKKSASQVTVEIEQGDQIPNKDFIFRYDVAGSKPEYALLTHATKEGDGYFMLMIQPKASFKIAEITPRELVFVVDRSGSMSGFPIQKVKEAMKLCIENLHPDDYFQVIAFSYSAERFAPSPVPNTPENVKKAIAYVESLDGSGGTEMLTGVNEALSVDRDPARKRRRFVLFMSDGYVGNEAEIIAAIEAKLEGARVFSFGVGSSVNRYLLEGMARAGRGYATYCRQDEDPQAAVQLFYDRIAKPFLMDIEIDWGGLEVIEVFPQRIPDLFSAQPVIIHGRYTKPGSAVIKVKGKVRGKPVIQKIAVVFPKEKSEHDVIATLWARTKISYLSDQMYHGEKPEIVDQITQIALKYKLMSKYTSFVAVSEEVRNVDGKLETVQVPIPIPEGVSYEGVFGEEEADMGYYGGMGRALKSAPYVAREKTPVPLNGVTQNAAGQKAVLEGSVSFETPTVLGALTADDVTKILEGIEDKLTDIYEKYLKKDSSIEGRAVFGITVKADGSIEAVVVKSSTLDNEDLEEALVKELGKLRFPAPSDGGKVIITVAVVFKT